MSVCVSAFEQDTVKLFYISELYSEYSIVWGHAVALWLRYYATSWKVAGSRPDVVNL
jgi:hypothetical protein